MLAVYFIFLPLNIGPLCFAKMRATVIAQYLFVATLFQVELLKVPSLKICFSSCFIIHYDCANLAHQNTICIIKLHKKMPKVGRDDLVKAYRKCTQMLLACIAKGVIMVMEFGKGSLYNWNLEKEAYIISVTVIKQYVGFLYATCLQVTIHGQEWHIDTLSSCINYYQGNTSSRILPSSFRIIRVGTARYFSE